MKQTGSRLEVKSIMVIGISLASMENKFLVSKDIRLIRAKVL